MHKQIGDLYHLEKKIGEGHFAIVKSARHIFSGERVAIKVIDKSKLDKVSLDHLFQEVKCMKLVQHPNVVRLYEVFDTPDKLYLILEFGDGGDMYDYIMRHSNGLTETHARNYFIQIVRAIKYCHDLHVVHRDLKPENVVFFEQTGQVKLTDFGFSNIFEPGTKLFTSCGSLAYSAPEILLGDSYDAPAVDVWSLGVILYMLVTGRAPFQEANDSETLTMILDCKYYLPPHLSKECVDLISSMLVRDPSKRITLLEILNHRWLKVDNGYFESFEDNFGDAFDTPLYKNKGVSDKEKDLVIEQMVNGKIGQRDEILKALEEDNYNYITATYYLLAERILKKQNQETNNRRLMNITNNQMSSESKSSRNYSEKSIDGELPEVLRCKEILETSQIKKTLFRKLGSKNSRNLDTQIEEFDDELEETAEILSIKSASKEMNLDSLIAGPESNQMTNVLLTNIIEDEDEDEEEADDIDQDDNKMILVNGAHNLLPIFNSSNSRRSSRGCEGNSIKGLTILEEIENESNYQQSNNNSQNLNKNYSKGNQAFIADFKENESDADVGKGNDKAPLSIKEEYRSSRKEKKKIGMEASLSDNSDSEYAYTSNKNDFNWVRTSSASSSKSNYRPSRSKRTSNSTRIKYTDDNGQETNGSRPTSVSSETCNDNLNSKFKDKNVVIRTKSLIEESYNNNGNQGFETNMTTNGVKKLNSSSISSNSHDLLNTSNHFGKSLSVEHRLANMSQLSINSQLVKNNSLKYPNRSGVCDTPVQHQISATPTPRESKVFSRGDEKPYAKILGQAITHKSKEENCDILNNDNNEYLKNRILNTFHSIDSVTLSKDPHDLNAKNFDDNLKLSNDEKDKKTYAYNKNIDIKEPIELNNSKLPLKLNSNNNSDDLLMSYKTSQTKRDENNGQFIRNKNYSYNLAISSQSNVDSNKESSNNQKFKRSNNYANSTSTENSNSIYSEESSNKKFHQGESSRKNSKDEILLNRKTDKNNAKHSKNSLNNTKEYEFENGSLLLDQNKKSTKNHLGKSSLSSSNQKSKLGNDLKKEAKKPSDGTNQSLNSSTSSAVCTKCCTIM